MSINREKENSLSHEFLLSVLDYDEETGIFTWKVNRRGCYGRIGEQAGSVLSNGYREISLWTPLGRCRFYAHRLAIFYMTRKWPKNLVDHREPNHRDVNSKAMLRNATVSQNRMNDYRGGLKGISFHHHSGLWRVRVQANKRVTTRYFKTKNEAALARVDMVRQLHGEFARIA